MLSFPVFEQHGDGVVDPRLSEREGDLVALAPVEERAFVLEESRTTTALIESTERMPRAMGRTMPRSPLSLTETHDAGLSASAEPFGPASLVRAQQSG